MSEEDPAPRVDRRRFLAGSMDKARRPFRSPGMDW